MWPEEIPYDDEHLQRAVLIQNLINNQLQTLLNEMKRLPIYGLQDSERQNKMVDKLCLLAQSLGIHEKEKPDDQIADEIITRMDANIARFVASVTVCTISHLFEGQEEVNESTRSILIYPVKFFVRKTAPLSKKNLRDATFSLLGSRDKQDCQILKVAFRTFRKVEIFITPDLQHHQIKWS